MEDRLFTGREKERRFFVSMLEGREPTRVLVITGMGGIGKTELLKQFQSLADDRKIAWAQVDGNNIEDEPRILDEIARQLSAKGVKLGTLGRSLREYARIKAKLPSPARAALTTAAEAIGGASQAIPGIPPELAAGAQAVSGGLAGSIYDVLKPADVELYLDAPRRLTAKFLESLRKTRREIVLFFDTYEKMLDLDSWLRDLAPRMTGQGVWLVIAGQVQLDTRWTNVAGVHEFRLGSLSLRESRSFLRRRKLTDPELIDSIVEFSGGIPLALHLAAELVLKYNIRDFGVAPERQRAVDQLLQRIALAATEDEMRVLLACAIPRALNAPLVERLLPDRNAGAIMADLRSRPYVIFRTPGIALHESLRDFAHTKLKFEDWARFKQLHEAAIKYYDGQLNTLERDSRQLSAAWHDLARERLYHTLHVDEDQGFSYFRTLYWQIDGRFQFAECLNLANSLLRFPLSTENLASEGLVFKAHALYDLNRWEDARTLCLLVLEDKMEPRIRGYVLHNLGRICTKLSQWEEAQDHLEAAIVLKRQLGDKHGLGTALMRLGDVHAFLHTEQGRREIQLFDEALAIFERLELKYSQADAHYHLSYSYRAIAEWEEAEEHARAALDLSEEAEQGKYRATFQQARTRDVLSHVYRNRGLLEDAERSAREALTLFRSLEHDYYIASALQGLAHVLLLIDKREEATACLHEAEGIARRINDTFTVAIIEKTFGQIHLLENRLDEAQAAFEAYLRAMEDFHERFRVALAHYHLGHLFYRRRDWVQAKRHLRDAIRFFYLEAGAPSRAAEATRLLALVLVGAGYRSGGLALLRFALKQANQYNLLHVQAWVHICLARTLRDEPTPDYQTIEQHLDVAAKLAEEQEYRDVTDQITEIRRSLETRESVA